MWRSKRAQSQKKWLLDPDLLLAKCSILTKSYHFLQHEMEETRYLTGGYRYDTHKGKRENAILMNTH